jgi:hypothetical protein
MLSLCPRKERNINYETYQLMIVPYDKFVPELRRMFALKDPVSEGSYKFVTIKAKKD